MNTRNPQTQESSKKPKHKKHEENYVKACHDQIAQNGTKEKIFKAAKEKKTFYTGTKIMMTADFSLETMQTRR